MLTLSTRPNGPEPDVDEAEIRAAYPDALDAIAADPLLDDKGRDLARFVYMELVIAAYGRRNTPRVAK